MLTAEIRHRATPDGKRGTYYVARIPGETCPDRLFWWRLDVYPGRFQDGDRVEMGGGRSTVRVHTSAGAHGTVEIYAPGDRPADYIEDI